MKFKKAMAFALTGALTAGAVCSGVFADNNQTTTVKLTVADPYDTDYIMTIPAEVNVAGTGFTTFDGGIKVSHNSEKTTTFDPNSKVTVSAASTNGWQLKATGVAEGIGYQLKGSAKDENATTSWEFTGDKITNDGETKAVGVDVENYDDAAPGEYTDTITFTAVVESTAVAVTGITLNKTETSIQVGNDETLSVTAITPDDATDKTYTWSSDKESVATVDANGKVTAVAAGTANITATANDGSGVTATCAVTVTPATITVTWNNNDITGTYGTSFTKDGVTITAGFIDFKDKNFMEGGTFSTTLGNFTKIEVSSGYCEASGTGWSGSMSSMTWTGNASSVSFSGDFMGMGMGNTKLVFTIEPTN